MRTSGRDPFVRTPSPWGTPGTHRRASGSDAAQPLWWLLCKPTPGCAHARWPSSPRPPPAPLPFLRSRWHPPPRWSSPYCIWLPASPPACVQQDVRYECVKGSKVSTVGVGKTLEVSSSEVRFTTEQPLKQGQKMRLAMSWPAMLDNTCRMKLEIRSEEHTSELQSLRHLVCRLL